MPLDLLHDPLIQTDRGWHSLPGILAAMARGEVTDFPALRPHQRPAWHMFLVQLAVLALDAAGRRTLPEAEEDWRAALRALTPGFPGDDPWHLVATDRAKPAFLQPPDPGGLKWSEVATPDALDMLITARNHDLKREIAQDAAPQDWLYALVSLQTMEGFGGAGNYGIARMNGGSSSRVLLTLVPALPDAAQVDPSAWWARDVRHLLAMRSAPPGRALLWLEPWPEGRSLDLAGLDPLFIEICRRIRLVGEDGRLLAERSTSKAARVAGKEARGNLGDPWAPVHVAEGKSLTLGERDWTSELLVTLLYRGEWRVPDLARPLPGEETAPMLLIAEALARGNSKTDGFKSRIVPVPKAVVAEMFGERPVAVSEGVLKDIRAVAEALTWAVRTVATTGDRDKLASTMKSQAARNRLDRCAEPARRALHRAADRMFFPELWARVAARSDADIDRFRLDFLGRLAAVARAEFRAALPGIPCASLMRPRAETRGRQTLERGLHKAMRDLKRPEVTDV